MLGRGGRGSGREGDDQQGENWGEEDEGKVAGGPEREENEGRDHDDIEWGRREGDEEKERTGEEKQERRRGRTALLGTSKVSNCKGSISFEKVKNISEYFKRDFLSNRAIFQQTGFLCSII